MLKFRPQLVQRTELRFRGALHRGQVGPVGLPTPASSSKFEIADGAAELWAGAAAAVLGEGEPAAGLGIRSSC